MGSEEKERSDEEGFRYMIIRSERAGIVDLWRFLRKGAKKSIPNFIDSSCDNEQTYKDCGLFGGLEERWVIVVSIILRKLLLLLKKPIEWMGLLVEFSLNLLYLNGNLLNLFIKIFQGKVVIPQKGSANFLSSTGYLDDRMNLYETDKYGGKPSESNRLEKGNRFLEDLCIMASKLAYENDNVVKEVVVNNWKMHFVGFYDCWNEYQKLLSTQVFILCDNPIDANVILVSFRGTEPFDARDWCTDFDYSWYEIPNVGRVHMGFLEALGLGSRDDTASFQYHLQVNDIEVPSDSLPVSTSPCPDMAKLTAYDTIKTKVKELLVQHSNAKLVVTGHSLGGALATLFPIVLALHNESETMEKLMAIYTFGQPRFADSNLGKFMETQFNNPEPRYFRVVYCNDVVPRLPYDDHNFLYKHFGVCLYYNGFYSQQEMDDEPNRNYFGIKYLIPEHVNAMWELIRAFIMTYRYGSEFKENWCSILVRVVGLVLPGISAHGPRDYINSVRLGTRSMDRMSSF